MLRFDSKKSRSIDRSARRLRWRLWALWIALGLVLLVMRNLQRPETAHRLGQLFPPPLSQTAQAVAIDAPLAIAADIDLSAIKDNARFLSKERPAWFALFAQLQARTSQQLAGAATAELTYAQLLGQPEVYRGRLVTVRGTVVREEVQQPAENDLGIETYHRLWLEPAGGGQWPLVVYVLDLPEQFPRGDKIRATILVRGFFFKNWSYPWQEGMGLAPVVLAREVGWSPPVVQPPTELPTGRQTTMMVLGATAFAGLAVWWAMRSTRRGDVSLEQGRGALPNTLEMPGGEDIQQQLERLAQTEGDP